MHMHSEDNGMPCEHLLVQDSLATCKLHETDLKPEVCRNYPDHPDFGGKPCLFEQAARKGQWGLLE